ncbi:hypothetical protein PT974_02640 [Cladobotryum mycophilum]|uniref:Uncharacterized protein n=1 Tax=Cladobotryum mycophilum TaxID=491253 RepID=A0ABR0SYM5_9HYPO
MIPRNIHARSIVFRVLPRRPSQSLASMQTPWELWDVFQHFGALDTKKRSTISMAKSSAFATTCQYESPYGHSLLQKTLLL